MLAGAYEGPLEPAAVLPAEPSVVFAGRHIPEKRAPAIVPAIAVLRARLPQLRALILGDGPEREEVQRQVAAHGLQDVIDVPGFVASEAVEDALSRALCMLLPSRREGYGLVVVEAAARGTPSVVVAGPDNAAVELISEGENGFIAATDSPEDLAAAIWAVHEAGQALRESTSDWFATNAARVSIVRSQEIVLGVYAAASARP
jgi:glycosyltransferase involved in cell wall biosynthesis